MTRSRQLWTQAGQGGDTSTYTLDLAGLALANPHGDVVTTVTVPDSGPAAGIDSWHAYDEHGNTIIGTIGEPPLKDTTGIGYGWVGNEQRATQITGLLLTGARLYNPTTGTFTSMDPVFGGNSTTYAYPQDPVNRYDLTGLFWDSIKKIAKVADKTIRGTFSGRPVISAAASGSPKRLVAAAVNFVGGSAISKMSTTYGNSGRGSHASGPPARPWLLKPVARLAGRAFSTPAVLVATGYDYATRPTPLMNKYNPGRNLMKSINSLGKPRRR